MTGIGLLFSLLTQTLTFDDERETERQVSKKLVHEA